MADLAREAAMKRKRTILILLVLFVGIGGYYSWRCRPWIRVGRFVEDPQWFLAWGMLYKFNYSNIEDQPDWPLVVDLLQGKVKRQEYGKLLFLCPHYPTDDVPPKCGGDYQLDPFSHKEDCPYGILGSYLFFQGVIPWLMD